MLLRSLLVWFALLVVASTNGALRQALLIPAMGATAGRAISTLLLAVLIALLTWLTIRWISPRSSRDAWRTGALWVGLTLAFEFLAGHYLFGTPWPVLLQDYDVFAGRIWVLVLIVTAVSPWACARAHGLLRGR